MNAPEADLLEEALSTHPRAELPPGFHNQMLARIKQTPQMARFHLTWLDYALGFFTLYLPLAGWLVWKSLPPEFFLRLKFQWMVLSFSNNLLFISLGLAFCLLPILFFGLRLLYRGWNQ